MGPTPNSFPKVTHHPGRETDEKTNNAVTREGWGPRRHRSQFEVLWGGEDQAEHQTVSLEEEEEQDAGILGRGDSVSEGSEV